MFGWVFGKKVIFQGPLLVQWQAGLITCHRLSHEGKRGMKICVGWFQFSKSRNMRLHDPGRHAQICTISAQNTVQKCVTRMGKCEELFAGGAAVVFALISIIILMVNTRWMGLAGLDLPTLKTRKTLYNPIKTKYLNPETLTVNKYPAPNPFRSPAKDPKYQTQNPLNTLKVENPWSWKPYKPETSKS